MVIFHNELLVSTEVIDESTEVIKKKLMIFVLKWPVFVDILGSLTDH